MLQAESRGGGGAAAAAAGKGRRAYQLGGKTFHLRWAALCVCACVRPFLLGCVRARMCMRACACLCALPAPGSEQVGRLLRWSSSRGRLIVRLIA